MYATKLKFRFKYDTSYFMVNPETFRFKHLPTDPKWQLTDTIMPLQLFEAGDSAIGQFNALCKPMQSDPDLERIAGLDEKQKLFEYADRAYKYNPRFPVVLALKQTYRAEAQVIKAFTDSSVENGILLINDAENGLMKSQGYIKEQKKSFPDKYTRLKKKNTTKDQEAKKTIRQITTDNKRLISESKKYTNSAKSKDKRVKTKYTATKKRTRGLDPQKINGQAASKNQKKPGAPELREIRDSVAARNKQIAEMKYTLDEKVDVIAKLQNKNSERLDSLALLLGTTDSVLVRQAIARINMHDDYDNEVILLNRLFKELKYQQADTLQKYYLVCYDTITSMHEQRQKMQLAQMDMYKKNLRNLEQYGKWCSADTTIAAQYVDMVKDYTECINSYIKDLAAYDAYVKANKKLFSGIEKLSKRQLKISAYMVKVEGCRKKLEEKKIKENQAFDTKENERQQLAVKDLLEQLQEISSGKVD